MCHPKNDRLIVRLIEEGRLFVCGQGRGRVFVRENRYGLPRAWRETGREETAQQAGKRPSAASYRRFSMRIDGRMRTFRVNRVVWVYYKGPTCLEIDHVNDDALDCGISNLNPLTRHENEAKKREGQWLRKNGRGPEDEETSTPGVVDGSDIPW